MAVYSLGVSEQPWQIQTTILEGVSYDYELRWNSRNESWLFRIVSTGNEFELSTQLRVGYDLLAPYRHKDNIPSGKLIIADNERVTGRIGRDNLGIGLRFELLYITEDDFDLFEGIYY